MKGILCTLQSIYIPHLMTFCRMIKGKNIRKSRCVRCSFKDFNRFKISHTYLNDIDEKADFFSGNALHLGGKRK